MNGFDHAAALDENRDQVVLYGVQQTYEYNGSVWRRVVTQTVPPILTGSGFVFDRVRGRVVMFGGGDTSGSFVPTTWEYDGADWFLVASVGAPIAPFGAAYHDLRGTVIAFGKHIVLGSPGRNSDLWEWDGQAWRAITAVAPPPSGLNGFYFGFTYDARRGVLVVSGRINEDPVSGRLSPGGETWEWNAVTGWQSIVSAATPVAYAGLAYDRGRGVQVLITSTGTWERSSGVWSRRTSGTSAFLGTLVGDTRRSRILVLGGTTSGSMWHDWSYGPTRYAQYEPHGFGCTGSLGDPVLTLRETWTRPWLGRTLEVRLDRLPTNTAMVVTGTNDTTSSGGPLPLDLRPYGMPNCPLRVSPELVEPVAGAANSAVYTLTVPNAPILIGQIFFQQALVPDPAAGNPAGAVMSESRRFVVGLD